jgi:hypothetical protein
MMAHRYKHHLIIDQSNLFNILSMSFKGTWKSVIPKTATQVSAKTLKTGPYGYLEQV